MINIARSKFVDVAWQQKSQEATTFFVVKCELFKTRPEVKH